MRTVISGLVNFVPIEKMRGLTGIFMCNLKPVKMRGVESQGMLMCASNADHTHVEPLVIETPSSGPVVGDRVYVDAYPGKCFYLSSIFPSLSLSIELVDG